MATRLERPGFFEGQYLGSADMEAIVSYTRDLAREHALAGHAWGIAIGLDLVEVASEGGSGAVDLFVMPGLAWDGYGRAIVLLAPVQVPLAPFSGLPSGNQQVWIRYDETPFRGLRAGFETCGAGDAFSRVRESFAIEIGPFARVPDRQSGVTIAGLPVQDARLAGLALSDTAPLMCDASLPQQEFPPDQARWLVPLGVANWVSGAPGSLQARSADVLKLSRTLRQMCGTVTESVYAADGVIRLRDRFTQFKAGDTADVLCAADQIATTDLINQPDRDDPTVTTDRLIGRELVWIEGDTRATGQVRLFGTRLELRDAAGDETAGVPLYARRAVSPNNLAAGQDFQIVTGTASDGKDRLTVGPAGANYGDIQERFILRTDGVLAVGLDLPADLKSDHVLFSRGPGITTALATNAGVTAKIGFHILPALTEAAHIAYADDTRRLRISVGTDLANAVTFTTTGHVGIRMDDPISAHVDANDLVIQNPTANVGLTLLGPSNSTGNIHFADGLAGSAQNRAGFIAYTHLADRMNFGTADAVRVTIDSQGAMGVGTETPDARIDIRETGSGFALKLNANSVQARDGGAVTRLDLQPGGGGFRVNGTAVTSARAVLTSDGRLGLGTETPVDSLHVLKTSPSLSLDVAAGGTQARLDFASLGAVRASVLYDLPTQTTRLLNDGNIALTVRQNRVGVNLGTASPANALHVRGTISGNAADTESHVALIENTAGVDADVLALRIGGGAADGSNNFITFFDSTGAIGRIERGTVVSTNPGSAGSFLRLISGGADFAESLPRAAGITPIGAGRIVGVKAGRISLLTEGADSLLITTDRAIVVGNARAGGEANAETVALVGQVPLSVSGPVRSGDFIVPSGRNDGQGRAIRLADITPALAAQVVGRAWQDKTDSTTAPVMVAVGMQGADAMAALSAALRARDDRLDRLQQALDHALRRLGTED